MKCAKCGNKIPNNSQFCNFCGAEQESVTIDSKLDNNVEEDGTDKKDSLEINNATTFKKKGFAIGICFLFVIVIGICIFINYNKLDEDEMYAVKIVKEYQEMLKDPDSIKLRSDVIVMHAIDNNENYRYCFFTASGSNSFGASISSTVFFKDGKYICDMDTNEDEFETDDEKRTFLDGKLKLLTWKLYGDNVCEEKPKTYKKCKTVKAKLIGDKLKIPYDD